MITARRKYLWFGGLALFLLALAAGLYIGSDRLLNDLLRPRLAALAAEKLTAEVSIDRLVWRDGGFLINDLRLKRPDHYHLVIPRLRIELTLAGLLRRHLASLEITSPDLLLDPAPPSEEESAFPAELPISFGRILLNNGRVVYRQTEEKRYVAKAIHFKATGGDTYAFTLAAILEENAALYLAGSAEWRQGLELNLESLSWNRQRLIESPLHFVLPAGDDPAADGRLKLGRFDGATLQRLLAGMQIQTEMPAEWDFALEGLELGFSLVKNRLNLGLSAASGKISRGELDVPLSAWNLELSGWGDDWQGKARGLVADNNPVEMIFSANADLLDGTLRATIAKPSRTMDLLMGKKSPVLVGGLRLEATLSGPPARRNLQVEIKGFPDKVKQADYQLNLAPLHLTAAVDLTENGWRGQGRLLLDEKELVTIEGNPERITAGLRPISWSLIRPLLGRQLHIAALQGGEGLQGSLHLARSSGDAWSGSSRLTLRQLGSSGGSGIFAADAALKINFAVTSDDSWSGDLVLQGKKLTASGLVLEGLTASSRWRFNDTRLSFAGTRVAARLSGPGEMSAGLSLAGSGFRQGDRWHIELSHLGMTDLEVMSEDGLAGLAGGRISGKGSLSGADNGAVRLILAADLNVSEVLWGPYYADLSEVPGKVSLRGDLFPETSRIELETLRLTVPAIVLLQIAGSASSQSLDLSGELELPRLGGPLNDLLRNILADSFPSMADARLDGALQTTLAIKEDNGSWRLRGEVRPVNLAFQLPDSGVSLAGLTGRLPFEVTSGKNAPAEMKAQRSGLLHVESLQIGPASLISRDIGILSSPDHFDFVTPLVLQIADGMLTGETLALGRNPDGLEFEGLFTVAGIELEALTRYLDLPTMVGRINANLGRIHYAEGILRSEGEARIDVFDGRIRIRNIRLDTSSLSYPQAYADIDFTAIDLYQLTQAFSFGVINGIVDGYVRDLRLFGTTPAKFSARLESCEQGKRNISVKALKNLTILSQGGLSAALSQGVYRFIDFYRYRKIGFICELENDVFKVRGTARSDSDRYLVYGGFLPPKIDIIAPPAAISFSEMLKRLQRIERAEKRQPAGTE